jgi:DNA-binding NtrC family response regulator
MRADVIALTEEAVRTYPTVRLAAQALGIATNTLRDRIRNCGLTRPTGRTPRQKSDSTRLRQALGYTEGHVRLTAELLGVSTQAIYERARAHGIPVGRHWVKA